MNGEIFIFIEAVLWSFFPIFTKLTYSSISPLYTAAISTLFAALFFAIVLTYQKRWKEIFIKEAWKDVLLVTLYIGVILYSLVFIGLKFTTAGNSALIGILEVFFSFIILGMLKKEKITRLKIGGAVLMALGAVFVLFPKTSGLNIGDFILILAQAFAPLGNLAQQNARKKISSFTIMFLRSIISGLALLVLAAIFYPLPTSGSLKSASIYLIINGILFMGLSKIFWIEGINKIEITKANTINIIIPFFTLIFAFLMLGEVPMLGQLLGIIPLALGAFLILKRTSGKSLHRKL
jgi:drug/metabolite transporter (DMT)-like permease